MDLLKALRRTTFLSAMAVLALGATEACAAGTDNTAVLGHISASVAATLNVEEISAVKFGNFIGAASSTLVLAPDGTLSGTLVPLYGANAPAPAGIGTGAQETASQAPGFYSIVTDGTANVYVTFADNMGNIIDPVTHPSNNVIMDGPDGSTPSDMYVDTFTFAEDDGTTGYSGSASVVDAVPAYGSYITVVPGGDQIRVGATLHTVTKPATGRYVGTYYVMVSY